MPSNPRMLRDEMVSVLPRVRRFAFALTGSEADADDLLQATVERVLRTGAPDGADIARWMFRVCKNIWIDDLRSSRAGLAAHEDHASERPDRVDGEALAVARLALDRAGTAMAELPEDQRTALALVVFGQCSYREAAEILDIPTGTIMSRVSRARRKLVNVLGLERAPGNRHHGGRE